MVSGGGAANARGLRFQNLCALDYALRELESGNSRITAISVESRTCPATGRVFQELDFSLLADDAPVVDAQVKSGSSAYSLPEAWRELWQLTDREVEEYLLVTNRRPARAVQRLAELLAMHRGSFPEFVGALAELCAGVRGSGVQIASASQGRLERLRRAQLVLSSQDVDSLQDALRDRIRELRRRYRKGAGTRSTGLVFRNVLDLIADRAGNLHDPVCAAKSLMPDADPNIATALSSLSEMVPLLREQAHGEVRLDFLAVIEAAHAVVQGDFGQAGDLIATVPEGCCGGTVDGLAWDFIRGHIIELVRTYGRQNTVNQADLRIISTGGSTGDLLIRSRAVHMPSGQQLSQRR